MTQEPRVDPGVPHNARVRNCWLGSPGGQALR
jgi:hypothetical protein